MLRARTEGSFPTCHHSTSKQHLPKGWSHTAHLPGKDGHSYWIWSSSVCRNPIVWELEGSLRLLQLFILKTLRAICCSSTWNDKHRRCESQTWTPTSSELLVGRSSPFQAILQAIRTGYRLNCILFTATECFRSVASVLSFFPWGWKVHTLQHHNSCLQWVQWPSGTERALNMAAALVWSPVVLGSSPSSTPRAAQVSQPFQDSGTYQILIIKASSSFGLLWDHTEWD